MKPLKKIPPIKELKRRLPFWLDLETLREVDREVKELRVSRQQILESAIKGRYSTETREDREAQIVRRLNRLDTRQKVIEHDLEVIAEILALYMRMWLATNIEVPESQKAALQAEGQKRYARFMESLSKRIGSGESILEELPRETSLTEEHF